MAELAGRRILIVDDANLVRRFYREGLERAGFEVDEAFNGLEALEKVLSAAYEMVIVDVNMPRMDGFTFIRTLRRQAGTVSSLPALMISTEAALQDAAAARAAGANFYLVKPISQEQLVEHVSIMCGLSK